MTNAVGPGRHSNGCRFTPPASARELESFSNRRRNFRRGCVLAALAAVLTLATLQPSLRAQGSPTITAVDPDSGKVNDSLSVSGENLGKGSVSAVFLSDDKSDYKAAIVSQNNDKIVFKVPQVKPGRYNVSIQTGPTILIQPVRFTVQE